MEKGQGEDEVEGKVEGKGESKGEGEGEGEGEGLTETALAIRIEEGQRIGISSSLSSTYRLLCMDQLEPRRARKLQAGHHERQVLDAAHQVPEEDEGQGEHGVPGSFCSSGVRTEHRRTGIVTAASP